MKDKIRALLIDPIEKSVKAVFLSTEDTWDDIYALVDFKTSDFVMAPGGHAFVVDDEALLRGDVNQRGFFQPVHYPQPIGGKSVLIGLTPHEGDFADCLLAVEQVEKVISWPQVEFMGMSALEPVEVEHPIFGTMTQHQTVAQFRPKGNGHGH